MLKRAKHNTTLKQFLKCKRGVDVDLTFTHNWCLCVCALLLGDAASLVVYVFWTQEANLLFQV